MRLALLVTSRQRERGQVLPAAQQLKQETEQEKERQIDCHRLDGWKDRKMGTEWNIRIRMKWGALMNFSRVVTGETCLKL